jgi:hypothetical protein
MTRRVRATSACSRDIVQEEHALRNDRLRNALSELAGLLGNSGESGWATESVEELRAEVDALIAKEVFTAADTRALQFLLVPTGSLQEIAIDNGWGDAYVRLAATIEAQLEATPN